MIFKTINSSVDETRTDVLNGIMSNFVILCKLIGSDCQNTDEYGESIMIKETNNMIWSDIHNIKYYSENTEDNKNKKAKKLLLLY